MDQLMASYSPIIVCSTVQIRVKATTGTLPFLARGKIFDSNYSSY